MKADRIEFITQELYRLGITDFGLTFNMPLYFSKEEVAAIHTRMEECGIEARHEDSGLFEAREME